MRPKHWASASCHSSILISPPRGEIQVMSLTPLRETSLPCRNRLRRSTGCALRSAISRATNAVILRSLALIPVQSNQLTSLSWQ